MKDHLAEWRALRRHALLMAPSDLLTSSLVDESADSPATKWKNFLPARPA
jgi:hypothetical protein